MKRIIPKGGCWPTPEQTLLLKAALLKGDGSLRAWEAWKAKIDIDTLEESSRRLLPLLYHNLVAQGVEDPLMGKFKGIYRYVLSINMMMFHRAAPVLKDFHGQGIDTLLLKGAAMIILNYKSHGLRTLSDVDILVRKDKVTAAVACLEKRGWKREYPFPLETILRFRHSCGFNGGKGEQIDLHWNILPECRWPDADDVFWSRSIPIKLVDEPTRTLTPTDHLFHACVYGLKWNRLPPCRWVADSMTLLDTQAADIEWDILLEHARARELTIQLREALGYLKKTFEAPIPDGLLEHLRQVPLSRMERFEFHVASRPRHPLFGNLLKYTVAYRRINEPQSFVLKVLLYPNFLQVCWRIKSLWMMPLVLIFWGIRRMLGIRG